MSELTTKTKKDEYTTIASLVIKGKTISEIAEYMSYSNSTVSNRLNTLFSIYNAKNRVENKYTA